MHKGTRRFSVQPCRHINLFDPAGAQHRNTVGHLHRFRLIVRNEDAGEAHSVMQRAQPHAKAFAHFRIECAEWFVEQQQLGLYRQRAGKCNALTLPAGDLFGIAVRQIANLHQVQKRLYARADRSRRRAAATRLNSQAKCHIPHHGHMTEQRVVLKYEANGSFACGHALHRSSIDDDGTGIDKIQPCQHAQQCRLAGARRSQ